MCLRILGSSFASSPRNGSTEYGRRQPLIDQEDGTESSSLRRSFSVVAHVVTAVKKFQASLNPTVTFRKRNNEDEMVAGIPPRALSEGSALHTPRLYTQRTFTSTPTFKRTASGRLVPRMTYERRGHMTGYLLMPLPELQATT